MKTLCAALTFLLLTTAVSLALTNAYKFLMNTLAGCATNP